MRRRHRRGRRDGGAAGGARRRQSDRARRRRPSRPARLHAARGRDAAAAVPGRRRAHHRRRRHHRLARARRRRLDGAQHQPVQARAAPVLDGWKLDGWRAKELAPHYEVVEHDLSVAPIEESRVNRNNAILRRGVEKLGWKGGILSHNRRGCVARASASSAAPSTPNRTRSRCSSPPPSRPARASRRMPRRARRRQARPRGRRAGARARHKGRAGATVRSARAPSARRAARSARRRWRCASGLPDPSGRRRARPAPPSGRGHRRRLRRESRLERHPAELGVHREAAYDDAPETTIAPGSSRRSLIRSGSPRRCRASARRT